MKVPSLEELRAWWSDPAVHKLPEVLEAMALRKKLADDHPDELASLIASFVDDAGIESPYASDHVELGLIHVFADGFREMLDAAHAHMLESILRKRADADTEPPADASKH